MFRKKPPYFSSKRKVKIKSRVVFEQQDINNLIFNTSLLQVVQDFVQLKKAGGCYVGRCPFCRTLTMNDKYFKISVKKKLYKCFQCGVGGKFAHTFLMRYFNKPFDEVMHFINEKYHDNKFTLTVNRSIVVSRSNIDEDSPW